MNKHAICEEEAKDKATLDEDQMHMPDKLKGDSITCTVHGCQGYFYSRTSSLIRHLISIHHLDGPAAKEVKRYIYFGRGISLPKASSTITGNSEDEMTTKETEPLGSPEPWQEIPFVPRAQFSDSEDREIEDIDTYVDDSEAQGSQGLP